MSRFRATASSTYEDEYSGSNSTLVVDPFRVAPQKQNNRLRKTAKYTVISIVAFILVSSVVLYFVADIPRIYIAAKQRVSSERQKAQEEYDSFICRIITNRVDELVETHQMDLATVNIIRAKVTHETVDRSLLQCQMVELIVKEWIFVQICKELIISITSGPISLVWNWMNNAFWAALPYLTPISMFFGAVRYGAQMFKDPAQAANNMLWA